MQRTEEASIPSNLTVSVQPPTMVRTAGPLTEGIEISGRSVQFSRAQMAARNLPASWLRSNMHSVQS